MKPIGFIGLGLMGEPMASNLLRANLSLVIWNRTRSKCASLAQAGATVADEASDVFAQCETIIFMLLDETALDEVLQRRTSSFAELVRSHTLINMATVSPTYSAALESDIDAAGGCYVEAPVSGSRKPAEAGELIGMLPAEPNESPPCAPWLGPMCREAVICGPVPNALWMKLAVNLYMIVMITGEAVNLARHRGLDLPTLETILGLGPMSSSLMRTKLRKLLEGDFTAQATIHNVLDNARLIYGTARDTGVASPLLDVCHALYGEANALGASGADMIAVIRAIDCRAAASS